MIGVLSDTHNSIPAIDRAVDFFNDRPVDLVIHAGDYTSLQSIEALSNLKSPLKGVAGNMDTDPDLLTRNYSGDINISPTWRALDYKNRTVYISHRPFRNEPVKCDVYIHGHTHQSYIEKKEYLKVNPGSCSDRHSNACVALIKPQKKEAQIYEI